MRIAKGNEVYACDCDPVIARGISLTDKEVQSALTQRLPEILDDQLGQQRLDTLLSGLSTTSFQDNRIKQILSVKREVEDWRVGEAIAEAYLVDHRACTFPWPSGRDLKNPDSSPAGADLVGFEKRDKRTRFAFGEVKTSQEQKWPPSAMKGRHGLSKQLESLRDSSDVKDHLVRYLGHRAPNTNWVSEYKDAAKAYLQDHADVALHGIMIRDVAPKETDLRSRGTALAKKRPTATSIELRAIYLPADSVKTLPTHFVSKQQGVSQ